MNARLEITPELLASLPPELLAQLKPAAKTVDETLLSLIVAQGGEASTDQLVIGYFFAKKEVLKRVSVNAATSRLVNNGFIKRVRIGVFAVIEKNGVQQ